MARLTAADRRALPKGEFALPENIKRGKSGKKQTKGAYPIPDKSHARNALARVSQFGSSGEKAAVRAKVRAKYPDIGEGD